VEKVAKAVRALVVLLAAVQHRGEGDFSGVEQSSVFEGRQPVPSQILLSICERLFGAWNEPGLCSKQGFKRIGQCFSAGVHQLGRAPYADSCEAESRQQGTR